MTNNGQPDMTHKRLKDMTPREILDRDMSRAEYGRTLSKRVPRSKARSERAKNNPAQLEQLASVRAGTQFGGDSIRRCDSISKRTGEQCRCTAIRNEKKCWRHASLATRMRVIQRRREEGRPVDHADKIARRNVRALLRRNLIPVDLMREPTFQAVMQVIAPRWFGQRVYPLGRARTQEELKTASLLSREMVLAWTHALDTGDLFPWTQAVIKARNAGFDQPTT